MGKIVAVMNKIITLLILSLILTLMFSVENIKGACFDPQPQPPPPQKKKKFKHIEIFVPKVESYLEDFVCEILCAKSV